MDATLDCGVSHTILVTLTLTSDLVCRIFVSRTYLFILGKNPELGVLMHLGMADCPISFSGHCDLEF